MPDAVLRQNNPTCTLAVAVSGGADSLYSLLELKASGVDVFAIHALFLPPALRPAGYELMLTKLRANCEQLGVVLYVVDLSKQFTQYVIRPFVESYLAGCTPNPCAHCNRHLKFGLLWQEAAKLGAMRLVTGHYARLERGVRVEGTACFEKQEQPTEQKPCDERVALLAAQDSSKDQSYFLALTPLEALQRVDFPLACKSKAEITAELERLDIELPQKEESQEICFIADNNYRAFLVNYAAENNLKLAGEGAVALPDGRIIARHKGLWHYTEGQRKGLGIAWSEPLFVLGKDIKRNILLVGTKADFSNITCECSHINWLVPLEEWPAKVWAKTRYRQKPEEVTVSLVQQNSTQTDAAARNNSPATDSNTYCEYSLKLDFAKGLSTPVAPGQIAVIYAETEYGWRVLAGGVITTSQRKHEALS